MMSGALKKFALILFAGAFLLSCKGEPPKEEAAPLKKAEPQTAQPAAAPAQPGREAEEAAQGKPARNPFLSHIILMAGVDKGRKVKGPLECCEITVFKLLAVVSGGDTPSALVQAPDGKRYIVKKGGIMGLHEGRVIGIESRGIVVRENILDDYGKAISSNDIELKLPAEREFEPFKP